MRMSNLYLGSIPLTGDNTDGVEKYLSNAVDIVDLFRANNIHSYTVVSDADEALQLDKKLYYADLLLREDSVTGSYTWRVKGYLIGLIVEAQHRYKPSGALNFMKLYFGGPESKIHQTGIFYPYVNTDKIEYTSYPVFLTDSNSANEIQYNPKLTGHIWVGDPPTDFIP